MSLSYGIDVGGTKIEMAVYDESFQRIDTQRVPTSRGGYISFLDTISSLVRNKDSEHGCFASVGIGVPCRFDDSGLTYSVNIPYLSGEPLARDLYRRLERPVAIENDSKAFAFSEYYGGAGEGYDRVLGLILGTGVAGGMVVNGKLLSGRQGVAGEFGHIPIAATLVNRHGLPIRSCPCGQSGCYEQYLAGPGLLWLSKHKGREFGSVLDIVAGIKDDEPRALEIMEVYRDVLACFLAGVVLFYDPDVIVLGGGLSNIEALYGGLDQLVAKRLLSGVTMPPLVPPQYGDASGSRGMAILGREAFKRKPRVTR